MTPRTLIALVKRDYREYSSASSSARCHLLPQRSMPTWSMRRVPQIRILCPNGLGLLQRSIGSSLSWTLVRDLRGNRQHSRRSHLLFDCFATIDDKMVRRRFLDEWLALSIVAGAFSGAEVLDGCGLYDCRSRDYVITAALFGVLAITPFAFPPGKQRDRWGHLSMAACV